MRLIYCVIFAISIVAVTVILFGKTDIFFRSYLSIETVDLIKLNEFYDYLKHFKKKYGAEEFYERKRFFEESLQDISRLNALHGAEVFGLTKFSDMSKEEFRRTMLSGPITGECVSFRRTKCPIPVMGDSLVNTTLINPNMEIPPKFDWRNKHVVGEVLDQKQCNGCWAFSVVGVMESMAAISGKVFTALSVQELIDCSTYNNGCRGGNAAHALDFLCIHDYPIVTMNEYPLKLVQQACMIPEGHRPMGRKIAEFTNDCFVNEKMILALIANHGPVTAAVNAATWINYVDGIIRTSCVGFWGSLNHVVQIVGYDLTGDVPYYIVKNSMGKDFGIGGYVKLEIFKNVCGIASNIAYLSVK